MSSREAMLSPSSGGENGAITNVTDHARPVIGRLRGEAVELVYSLSAEETGESLDSSK